LEVRAFAPPPLVEKGENATVRVALRNGRLLPAFRLDVAVRAKNGFAEHWNETVLVTALRGREEKDLRFGVKSDYCGRIRVAIDEVCVRDVFSLLSFVKRPAVDLHTAVLPELREIADAFEYRPANLPEGESFSPYRPGDDPSEIFDIREYADGDKYRRIHRKLSIKQNRLMVKEYALPVDDSVTLLIDLCVGKSDNYMAAVDAVLREAFSLSARLMDMGSPHRIGWFDAERDEVIFVAVRNENDMYEAMGGVLDITAYRGGMSGVFGLDLPHRRYSHLFLFIPSDDFACSDELEILSDRLSIYYVERGEEASSARAAANVDESAGAAARRGLLFGEARPIRLAGRTEAIDAAL
jgi:hypothetical protein